MSSYPVNLDLTNKKCAVIGGGKVALRKVQGLLKAAAIVTVISPQLDEQLGQLAERGCLQHLAKEYQTGDLPECFLVICASDNHEANKLAARDAKTQGALVNVADSSFPSDFTLPARVERGQLLLTVSTGGLSPAFSVLVKEQLEQTYNNNYVEFLQYVAGLRVKFKTELATSKQRETLWRQLLTQEILALVQAGNISEAKVRVEDAVSRFGSQP